MVTKTFSEKAGKQAELVNKSFGKGKRKKFREKEKVQGKTKKLKEEMNNLNWYLPYII